jgi:taurine dioxygenase
MGAVQSIRAAEADRAPSFRVERMTASIGAEISGLDLSQPLSDGVVAELSDALVRHRVIVFRDQAITTEQHLAFGRRFGPLEVHPFAQALKGFGNDAEESEVLVIESTPDRPVAADEWHSDVTWRLEPSLGSILRCRICPEAGGDTLWANMVAAYEGLDDATRSRLSGMTAIHDWEAFRSGLRKSGIGEDVIAGLNKQYPLAEHPVVRTHPVSGEKAIYVNRNFTVAIKDMGEAESTALLERLYRLASVPDYQARLRWKTDTIAFWDNRSTQHYATKDFWPAHRRMERVTVAGDRPY